MCPRISHFEPRGSWHLMRLELCVFNFLQLLWIPSRTLSYSMTYRTTEGWWEKTTYPQPSNLTSIHTFKSSFITDLKAWLGWNCQFVGHWFMVTSKADWGPHDIEAQVMRPYQNWSTFTFSFQKGRKSHEYLLLIIEQITKVPKDQNQCFFAVKKSTKNVARCEKNLQIS